MGEVGCLVGLVALLVGWVALIVGCLGYFVLALDMSEVVNNIQVTSVFGFQLMLVGSIGVSGPCILHIFCVTWSKLAYYHSTWHGFFWILITLLTPCVTFLF